MPNRKSPVPIPQAIVSLSVVAVPFALWLLVFRRFVFQIIPVNIDTYTMYGVAKFYFNNVLNGVVPLWNPYAYLGRPFYEIVVANLFHPLMQLVPLLKVAGLDYYTAFMTYLVCYLFFGALGFYCFAKQLFQDRLSAFTAYVLFLFSGLGAIIFNQVTLVVLFVPVTWFFCFLFKFGRGFGRGDFLGLVMSLMMLVSAYIPFYFLTLMLAFVPLWLVLFWREARSFSAGLTRFCRSNGLLVALAAAGLLVACIPMISYKLIDASGDTVYPARHCSGAMLEECYDKTLHNDAGMTSEEITRSGSLGERVHFSYLFSHLDKLTYGTDHLFFIPVFGYLLIVLGAFMALDRRMILLITLTTFLILVSLGASTPVHGFLYRHLFFFKYFRNLFYFMSFIMPLLILIAVGQLKALLAVKTETFSRKKGMIVLMALLHGASLLFLVKMGYIIVTSFVTVAASFIFFVLYYAGPVRRWAWAVAAGIFLLCVLQPAEVFHDYSREAMGFKCSVPKTHVHPEFCWLRPAQEDKKDCMIFDFVMYEHFWNMMVMKESFAKIGYPDCVTRWTFILSQWMEESALGEYARHKFIVYDQVEPLADEPMAIRDQAPALPKGMNMAYVSSDSSDALQELQQTAAEPVATFLDGPSEYLSMRRFDTNRVIVQTHFPVRKFLVYNDTFTRHWKAFINGKAAPLARANVAFKGVWVPAGDATVEFRYSPPIGGGVYLFVAAAMLAFFLGTIGVLGKERNWPWQIREGAL